MQRRTLSLSFSWNILVVVVVVVIDQRASLITLRILIIAVLSLSFRRDSLLLVEMERKISFAREIPPLLEIRIEISRDLSFGTKSVGDFFVFGRRKGKGKGVD